MLKNEITVVGDQCEKQREAKEVIMTLNTAYKKQVTTKMMTTTLVLLALMTFKYTVALD